MLTSNDSYGCLCPNIDHPVSAACPEPYTQPCLHQAHCQAADKARRQQLLNQLLGRLANAEQQRQVACAQRGSGVAKRCSGSRPRRRSSSSGLKRLVAVRGLEDWMQVSGAGALLEEDGVMLLAGC
jgi:hypothetical protein